MDYCTREKITVNRIDLLITCNGCQKSISRTPPEVKTYPNTDSTIGISVQPCQGCIDEAVAEKLYAELKKVAKKLIEDNQKRHKEKDGPK